MLIDPYNPMPPVFAFTENEETSVQHMLETLVRSLRIVPGGGKMEEGYWSYIYHTVRNAPVQGWSNLTMRDFCYNGLGVEMKLLQRRLSPIADQGRRIMHPAATRALLFDPKLDAEICKSQILEQFGVAIAEFRDRVSQTCLNCEPDIRWGVLLWSRNLDEFLYFEETIKEPNPDDFYARFVDGRHRGDPTRNLHIFEKKTNVKRYSVTMPDKGSKLQPYFDVPMVGQGAYAFKVPNDGRKPLWLKEETIRYLEKTMTDQDQDIDASILSALNEAQEQ